MTGRTDATGRLRQILLILFVLGAAATAADLVLVEHFEDSWQIAPFVLLALAAIGAAACLLAPQNAPVRAFRLSLLLLIAGGIIGTWLHYDGNMEFEREVSPGLAGAELFWKAVKGASPPSLAPLSLIHLGLLGLASTYRHPAAARTRFEEER